MLIIPYILLSETHDVAQAFRSPSSGYSRWEYLLTQFAVIVTYIRLFFLPVNQNLEYDYPLYSTFLTPQVLLSFLFLLMMFCFACWRSFKTRKRDSGLSLIPFGLLWFLITVSVTSSIVPTVNLIYEHRVYLPSIGALLAFTGVTVLFLERTGGKKIHAAVIGTLVLIPLVLSYAAYKRNGVWESNVSLWEDVVRKSPERARAHYNLSIIYMREGLTDKAIKHYRTTLRLNPDYPGQVNRLTIDDASRGFTDKAIEHYMLYHAKAHNIYGNEYKAKGQIDMALKHYKIALKLRPDLADTHYNLGTAYTSKGVIEKAIEHFQTALSLKPYDPLIHNNLGVAFISSGLSDKAIEHFQVASRLNPDLLDAHFNLGLAYREKGFTDKARAEFETVLKIDPGIHKARMLIDSISKPEPY
jgi:Tfp pilus assembly protein PilF